MNEDIYVILAEDEESLGMIVKESLETRDFKVQHCLNGEEALEAFRQSTPDILVLDVMMPRLDGFSLADKVRSINPTVPIIFLTSRSRTEDVVEGFGRGGSDYLKKPFSMEELIVRIKALLNRNQGVVGRSEYHLGRYIFYPQSQELEFEGKRERLTGREAKVLKKLADNVGILVEKGVILNEFWGEDDFFNGRSLDVFISRLRKKLQKDDQVTILNERGYGYKLVIF